MASLHCNGFSAHLSLLATPLQPLSSSVNPHAPHAVEGIYAAPLAPGQPWTLVWSDDRAVPTAVDAGVLVCDGANAPVRCELEHGKPTSLSGYLDTGPLKITLLLRDQVVNEMVAIFVMFCADSTSTANPTGSEAVFLPTDHLAAAGPSHRHAAQNRETLYMPHRRDIRHDIDLHRRIATPQSSPETMLDAAGADDSGVLLTTPERRERAQLVDLETLRHTERELDFYRAAVHSLERSMSPASHIRFLTERLVRDRTGGPDCPQADDRALTVAARVHTAVAREQMLRQLGEEREAAVTEELAGVLRMLPLARP
ncbi:uncharacterized protein RHOBADRAFT_41039 [Rhodotorula graminis WP1]|uniref:Uncharacterized protein n=1 Tax=Rhodotorula graminis (strain WP1) TaxID=578459 RepID=A0A194SD06_RHOGW|nr:uncharacterized protein RHOBADRAFT_41039 [Rhodotorula graminis WP1]KPV78494.1 hypothetical protein RHOBADRAFT_41039 [Rhodotorula graminis WP1]